MGGFRRPAGAALKSLRCVCRCVRECLSSCGLNGCHVVWCSLSGARRQALLYVRLSPFSARCAWVRWGKCQLSVSRTWPWFRLPISSSRPLSFSFVATLSQLSIPLLGLARYPGCLFRRARGATPRWTFLGRIEHVGSIRQGLYPRSACGTEWRWCQLPVPSGRLRHQSHVQFGLWRCHQRQDCTTSAQSCSYPSWWAVSSHPCWHLPLQLHSLHGRRLSQSHHICCSFV